MSDNNLVFAAPESLGIPSQAILDFLNEMEVNRLPIHSYLFMRHGQVAAEGYCPYFDANHKHRMYSISKSFTSVAVGMLIDEGKLSLTDKVAAIFPEYIPENPSPYILEATVRDLLTMATFNETNAYEWDSPDFVKAFFDNPYPKHKPGTVFHYDTAATVTLCGIVEKLTGKPILDYMRPVLDAIAFSRDAWCIKTPEGRSWTGSGIMCTARDLAKFGLFCLHRGEVNGRQLVSREYMEAATSKQINTFASYSGVRSFGYGYQFWMMENGGFACCGMGSQFAFLSPVCDTVMVITADTQGIDNAEDFIRDSYYRLLARLSDEPLPENAALNRKLDKRSSLSIPLPDGKTTTSLAGRISGVKYEFEPNLFGFQWMRVEVGDGVCTLTYEKKTGVHSIELFMGRYGDFSFPDAYWGRRIGVSDTHYHCISAAAWDNDNTLLGLVHSVDDYLGTIKMQLSFVGDTLTVFWTVSAEAFFGDYRGYLAGHAVKA